MDLVLLHKDNFTESSTVYLLTRDAYHVPLIVSPFGDNLPLEYEYHQHLS